MRRILLLFTGFSLLAYLIGCGTTTSITRPITVTVAPTTASVPVGQAQTFIATVTGTPNTGVAWTLTQGGAACSPGCGTLAPTSTTSGTPATYTAPAAIPAHGATVTITPSVGISVSPTTASVVVGQTQAFTATVTGSTNTNVNWTLTQAGAACSPSCGTIAPPSTANGISTTYTAPAAVPPIQTVTLTATSVADPTKSATATITVTTQTGGTVAGSPANAAVEVFSTQPFSATINGQPTTAVTWQVNGTTGGNTITGTISTSGLYSAPHSISNSIIQPNGAPVTVTITAVSTANPANSGSATVTLMVPGKSAVNTPIQLGTSGSNALDFK